MASPFTCRTRIIKNKKNNVKSIPVSFLTPYQNHHTMMVSYSKGHPQVKWSLHIPMGIMTGNKKFTP